MTTVIEAEGLTKRFGSTQALAGVDIGADRGQVLALLGPNGAGKTTIVRVLATLLKPDGGNARICGYDVVADAVQARQLLALTGQYASVDDELTGTENLIMICRLLGLRRAVARGWAREMLDRFDLTDAAGRAVKTYSGGMRRRLDLAASLLGEPDVLFLDEPTTGLDPRARNQMWETIRSVVADGATVLLTTQYLEEADELADQIAVIDHGLVVAAGTPAELKARTGSQTLVVRAVDPALTMQVAVAVTEVTGVRPEVRQDTGLVTAPVSDPAMVPAVLRRLDEAGIVAAELALRLPSLDEVFLTLTGHHAQEHGEAEPGTTDSAGMAA
jgi:oleandomycin transport system ATP-binding protein